MLRRVAFQGELGAFGEDAIAALWPNEAVAVPQPTFAAVVRAVTTGGVDAGVLPVENTIAGSVRESVDALAASDAVRVIDEVVVPVTQCLMAPNGAMLESLAVVESHPVAIAQCKRFLSRRPWITVVMKHDTAGAARAVASAGDLRRSAIAGRRAALRYGLVILAEGIQDTCANTTRFVVIARQSRDAMTGGGGGGGGDIVVMHWRRFHAIRGATTVDADDPSEIREATHELLRTVLERNGVAGEEIVSVLFSATSDLTSDFPARAAREMGWTDMPLMCMTEIPVRGALPRCIRVMLHVELAYPRGPMVPVYLKGAEALRPDLVPALAPAPESD